MTARKRTIAGRDYWFTPEQACRLNPETGELTPVESFYCVFSAKELDRPDQGTVLKDDRGRAQLFPTAKQAVAAGIREVEARLKFPARAFAVGLPRGIKETEFSAYTELLRQQGIEVAAPQVPDSFGRRWLHAWSTRNEAEQFAVRLRRTSGNRSWEVYDLSPPPPANGQATEGRHPIVILIGRQSEGNTYGLHPTSIAFLQQQVPTFPSEATLFLSNTIPADAVAGATAIYDHLASMLTGLLPERLLALGGYRISDPITDLVLYKSDLVDASGVVEGNGTYSRTGGQGAQASR